MALNHRAAKALNAAALHTAPGRLGSAALGLIVLCALAYVLDGLTNAILAATAPGIGRSLHLGPKDLGPVFSAGLVGQSIGLMLVSLLPLRVGHRPVVVGSVLAFGVFVALSAMAGSRDQLIALRFLTGIGLGGALPSCMALVSELIPAQRRGLAVMSVFVGFAIGSSAAGAVAAAFVGPGGWRWVLGAAGAFSLLAAAALWRWLPESPDFLGRRNAPKLLPNAVIQQRSVVHELVSPLLLSGTLLIWLFYVCAQVTSLSFQSFLPIMLEKAGRAPAMAALAISAFNIGGLVSTVIMGWLMDRFGAIRMTFIVQTAAALSFLIAGSHLDRSDRLSLQFSVFVLGFFSQGAYAAINVVATQYYPVALRSAGLGWAKGVSRLGAVVGPIILGSALAAGASTGAASRAFAILMATAAVSLTGLWVLSARRKLT